MKFLGGWYGSSEHETADSDSAGVVITELTEVVDVVAVSKDESDVVVVVAVTAAIEISGFAVGIPKQSFCCTNLPFFAGGGAADIMTQCKTHKVQNYCAIDCRLHKQSENTAKLTGLKQHRHSLHRQSNVSTAGTTVSHHYSLHCCFGLHNSIQATALSAAAAGGGDADTQVYTDCRG